MPQRNNPGLNPVGTPMEGAVSADIVRQITTVLKIGDNAMHEKIVNAGQLFVTPYTAGVLVQTDFPSSDFLSQNVCSKWNDVDNRYLAVHVSSNVYFDDGQESATTNPKTFAVDVVLDNDAVIASLPRGGTYIVKCGLAMLKRITLVAKGIPDTGVGAFQVYDVVLG